MRVELLPIRVRVRVRVRLRLRVRVRVRVSKGLFILHGANVIVQPSFPVLRSPSQKHIAVEHFGWFEFGFCWLKSIPKDVWVSSVRLIAR